MERKETVLRFGLYIEELDEPVLSLLDELNGGVVLRLEGDELAVLVLALLRRLCNRLVEGLCCDEFCSSLDELSTVRSRLYRGLR